MRSLFAFFSKEMTDHIRSGKFLLFKTVQSGGSGVIANRAALCSHHSCNAGGKENLAQAGAALHKQVSCNIREFIRKFFAAFKHNGHGSAGILGVERQVEFLEALISALEQHTKLLGESLIVELFKAGAYTALENTAVLTLGAAVYVLKIICFKSCFAKKLSLSHLQVKVFIFQNLDALFNISFAGALPLDPVVGTIATLLAAWGMWLTRKVTVKGLPVLGLLMPAVANAFLVGWELSVYIGGGFWINALYVAIGEVAVLLTLGTALYYALKPHKARLFER